MESQDFKDGRKAYLDGNKLPDNPHAQSTLGRTEWTLGFMRERRDCKDRTSPWSHAARPAK